MKIRVKYQKTPAGRFLSHLDLMHAWERAIRRTGAPLGFSQGFNPHPKLSFGSALSVGVTSDGEYMDLELTQRVDLAEFTARLGAALPPALAVLETAEVAGKSEALMAMLDRARYRVDLTLSQGLTAADMQAVLADFWAKDEVIVLRFKKNSKDKREVNIRPGVFALSFDGEGREVAVEMLVKTGNEGNVRPDEVIFGLMSCGLPIVDEISVIHRLGIYMARGDELHSPMAYCAGGE